MLTWPCEEATANRPLAARSPQPMASRAGVSRTADPTGGAEHQPHHDEDGHRGHPHAPQGEQGRLRPRGRCRTGPPEAHRRAAGEDDGPRRASPLSSGPDARMTPTMATSMPTHAQVRGSSPETTPSTTGTTTPSAAIGATTPIVPADRAE